jgi:phosphoglucomutase
MPDWSVLLFSPINNQPTPKHQNQVLKRAFDFPALKAFVARPGGFKLLFDAMHGVAAPYAQAVLGRELGCGPSCFLHPDSKADFGGLHPDPNLAYASDLVKAMGLLPTGAPDPSAGDAAALPDLGAAADGDADRNMVLGKQVRWCVRVRC